MSLKICDETPSRASPSLPARRDKSHIQDRRLKADEVARVHLGLDHRRLARRNHRGIRPSARAAARGPKVEDRDRLRQPVYHQKVMLDLHSAGNRAEVMLVLGKKSIGPRGSPHRSRTQPDQEQSSPRRTRNLAESSSPPAILSILCSTAAHRRPQRPCSLPIVITSTALSRPPSTRRPPGFFLCAYLDLFSYLPVSRINLWH